MIETEEELTEFRSKGCPIILEIFADDCSSCKEIASEFTDSAKDNPGVTHLKARLKSDQEAASNSPLATLLNATLTPTFILFDKAGNEVARLRFTGDDKSKLYSTVQDLQAL